MRKEVGCQDLAVIVSNVRICDKDTLVKLNREGQSSFPDIPQYLADYFKDESEDIEFQSFPAMIWPGYEKFGQFKPLLFPAKKPNYCGPLFETYTILANGDVVPCCYDLKGEVVFGNMFSEDMFAIWHGQKYTGFRDRFRKQHYDSFCLKCNLVVPQFLCKTGSS